MGTSKVKITKHAYEWVCEKLPMLLCRRINYTDAQQGGIWQTYFWAYKARYKQIHTAIHFYEVPWSRKNYSVMAELRPAEPSGRVVNRERSWEASGRLRNLFPVLGADDKNSLTCSPRTSLCFYLCINQKLTLKNPYIYVYCPASQSFSSALKKQPTLQVSHGANNLVVIATLLPHREQHILNTVLPLLHQHHRLDFFPEQYIFPLSFWQLHNIYSAVGIYISVTTISKVLLS